MYRLHPPRTLVCGRSFQVRLQVPFHPELYNSGSSQSQQPNEEKGLRPENKVGGQLRPVSYQALGDIGDCGGKLGLPAGPLVACLISGVAQRAVSAYRWEQVKPDGWDLHTNALSVFYLVGLTPATKPPLSSGLWRLVGRPLFAVGFSTKRSCSREDSNPRPARSARGHPGRCYQLDHRPLRAS